MFRCPPCYDRSYRFTGLLPFVLAFSLSVPRVSQAYSLIDTAFSPERADAGGRAVDTVTLTSFMDNTLYETSDGGLSNGSGSAMFAGRNSASVNSVRRAVLAFDLAAAIPAGSMIENVELRLYNDAANVAPAMLSLHHVTQSWGEGASLAGGGQGSGAPAAPGDATWLYRFYNANLWSTLGGDYMPSASAAAIVEGPGFYLWPSTAMLVDDVQSFLDHPADNFGWLLLGDETASSTAKRFATREALDPNQRPSLTIEFIPVPEPSSCCLLVILTFARPRRGRGPHLWRITPWRGHLLNPGPHLTQKP